MNQVNLKIRLDPERMNFPLPTMYARLLHSFVVEIENIPDDVTQVVVSVFKTDGVSRFDVPVSRKPGTTSGVAYLLPTVFPDKGSSFYEVRATDARGNETAFGGGLVNVSGFSPAIEPVPPDTPRVIHSIADASGALHQIVAVPDGEGGYTTIIDP